MATNETKRHDMEGKARAMLVLAEPLARSRDPGQSVPNATVGILAILISINYHLAQISAALGLKLEE